MKYSVPPLRGHSQQRPPSLMWPQIFVTATMNTVTSPSRQRPPLERAVAGLPLCDIYLGPGVPQGTSATLWRCPDRWTMSQRYHHEHCEVHSIRRWLQRYPPPITRCQRLPPCYRGVAPLLVGHPDLRNVSTCPFLSWWSSWTLLVSPLILILNLPIFEKLPGNSWCSLSCV